MSFGWSAGDIAVAVRIVYNVYDALDSCNGATKEYRETVSFAKELTRTLEPLKTFTAWKVRPTYEKEIQEQVEFIKGPIQEFLETITKYEPSLGHKAKGGRHRNIIAKMDWHMFTSKKVLALKQNIKHHMRILDTLMQRLTLDTVLAAQQSLPEVYRTALQQTLRPELMACLNETLTSMGTGTQNQIPEISPELSKDLILSIQGLKLSLEDSRATQQRLEACLRGEAVRMDRLIHDTPSSESSMDSCPEPTCSGRWVKSTTRSWVMCPVCKKEVLSAEFDPEPFRNPTREEAVAANLSLDLDASGLEEIGGLNAGIPFRQSLSPPGPAQEPEDPDEDDGNGISIFKRIVHRVERVLPSVNTLCSFVLGALPLVIGALSAYKARKRMAGIFKFRGGLERLIHQLSLHRMMFYLDIIDLLRDARLSKDGDPTEEKCVAILQDPKADIQVRNCLGQFYGSLLGILKRYEAHLKELAGYLERPRNEPNLVAIICASGLPNASLDLKGPFRFIIDRGRFNVLASALREDRHTVQELFKIRKKALKACDESVQY